MKLSDYRSTYYEYTGTASSVSRQAAFAGIALIWVFNNKTGSNISLPIELLWPTLFLVIGLGLDLLQYLISSAIWGLFHRLKEKKHGPTLDPELTAPVYFNWPGLFCFWGKLVSILVGYALLFNFVRYAIKFSSST